MQFVKKLLKTRLDFRPVVRTLAAVAGVMAFIYVSMNASTWHSDYIVDSVGSQVVKLVKPSNHGHGGTGFAIQASSGKVYTLTNDHVCRLNENGVLHAILPGDERFYELRVLEKASFTDLCVLEAMPGYSGVKIADSADLGEEVSGVGHPLLMPLTLSIGRLISNQTIQVIFA